MSGHNGGYFLGNTGGLQHGRPAGSVMVIDINGMPEIGHLAAPAAAPPAPYPGRSNFIQDHGDNLVSRTDVAFYLAYIMQQSTAD